MLVLGYLYDNDESKLLYFMNSDGEFEFKSRESSCLTKPTAPIYLEYWGNSTQKRKTKERQLSTSTCAETRK